MQYLTYHNAPLAEHTFLVTGGAGFIGSHITAYLLQHGAGRVVALDNLSNGHKLNIAPFQQNESFAFIKGDITDYNTCFKACENIDYVFHQAALGSVPRSLKDPLSSHAANVTGTLNMLQAAKEQGAKRFVYASSSSVYGNDQHLPKVENRTGDLLSPYAATKKADELYGQMYSTAYGLATIGLRYFNVYGPRQDPEGPYAAVIPLFAKAALEGDAPKIFGDGEQSRDFTFVENVVQANIKAMFTENATAFGKAFNIGNGGSTSVNELAEIIINVLGANVKAEHLPPRDGDIKDSQADISRAKNLLGYEPQFTFEQGLRKALDFYKQHYS